MRNPAYRRLAWHMLTLGPVGTALPAPGTWASALTTVVLSLVWRFLPASLAPRMLLLWALGALIAFGGTLVLRRVLHPGMFPDQPSIVLDEVAGMLVAAAPGGVWTQGTFVHLFIAFVLFRLFDIVKPFGIRSIDRRGTPPSVFADDIAAGGYAAACLIMLALLLR